MRGQWLQWWFVWIGASLALVTSMVHGQIDPTDLKDRNLRREPLLALEQATVIDEDLGILEPVVRRPRPPWLVLATEERFLYLDNVFLTENNHQASVGWDGWFELELAPVSTYRWRPRLTIEQEMFRFARAAEADFDTQTVTLENSLALTPDRFLRWDVSYAYWRVVEAHADDADVIDAGEFHSRLIWSAPLQSRAGLWATAFWDLEVRNTSPGFGDRLSHELHFSIAWVPTSAVTVSVFAEPEWRFYPKDPTAPPTGRDFHLDTGVLAEWAPWRYLSFLTELRWTANESNVSTRDYRLWELSLSLYARLQF